MKGQYQVIEYKIENLISVFIAQNISTLPTVINCKLHIEYFNNYFEDLKANTIIVDSKYIDWDFI